MTNARVIEAWAAGRRGHNGNGSFTTDGHDLFSYALKIGQTSDTGCKMLGDYTSGGDFHSVTTSQHVGRARTVADLCYHPETGEVLWYHGNMGELLTLWDSYQTETAAAIERQAA